MIIYPYTDTGVVRTIIIDGARYEGSTVGTSELLLIADSDWGVSGIMVADVDRVPVELINVHDFTTGDVNLKKHGIHACLTSRDFLKWRDAMKFGGEFDSSYLDQKDERGLDVLIAVKRFDSVKGMYIGINIA